MLTLSEMSLPDYFRRNLLEGLYEDSQNGRGTDLEVLVPAGRNSIEGNHKGTPDGSSNDDCTETNDDGGDGDERVSFHLHSTIVAASSAYFETFPEPKAGRVIDDLDAETFSICVRYMYTGRAGEMDCRPCGAGWSDKEYRERLGDENVASVLYAAELLQIADLKKKCICYLKEHLSHSNYQPIIELADRFNSPELKKQAKLFQVDASNRDDLVAEKATLVEKLRRMKHEHSEHDRQKWKAERRLSQIEEQLKLVFEKQREQEMLARWEDDAPKQSGQHLVPFAFGTGRKPGSIGHIVPPAGASGDGYRYYGRNTYVEQRNNQNSDADESVASSADRVGEDPPPPPTREEYEKYGIMKSHSSIKEAIESASHGDRIYLNTGTYNDSEDMFSEESMKDIRVEKELEFIGLGDHPSEVVLEFHVGDEDRITVSKSTGFFNLCFQVGEQRSELKFADKPNTSQGSGDEALIIFDDCASETKASLTVKRCVFDMGEDCDSSHPTRVSGIFMKRGASAVIEGCGFYGGAGSAIVVLNDENTGIFDVKITRNLFANGGQPSFSEISATGHDDNEGGSGGSDDGSYVETKEFKCIPSHERTPGPAALELWKKMLNRWESRSAKGSVSIKMTGNKLLSNLRAPLAHRKVTRYSPCYSEERPNKWLLHCDSTCGEGLNSFLQGFNLSLTDNMFEDNGLHFDKDAMLRMLCNGSNEDRESKKMRTESSGETTKKFPNGISLLVIEHFISQFDQNSFPNSWGNKHRDWNW